MDTSRARPRPTSEYDAFADIYDLWTETAASPDQNLPFYVDAYVSTEGPVVELGIGDGRIGVEAASRGCHVIGVDTSTVMLRRCRERSRRAGVEDRLTLTVADFRNFTLAKPAALITLPYHSIGHLLTVAAKRQAVERVFSQLRPGGRFIFDDFVVTPDRIARMRQVQLRAAYRSPVGTNVMLWVTSSVDESTRRFTVITWQDDFNAQGMLEWRRYRRLSLSWLEPDESRMLLEEAGFVIEQCLGDFTGSEFSRDDAAEQIWIARKPSVL